MKYRILDTKTYVYLRDGVAFKEFNSRIEAMAYMTANKMPFDEYEVVGFMNETEQKE